MYDRICDSQHNYCGLVVVILYMCSHIPIYILARVIPKRKPELDTQNYAND
jgi:hypothetical protein